MCFSRFRVCLPWPNKLTFYIIQSVTEDIYNRLVRYTRFSAAAYSSDCRVPPEGATVVSYINNNTTDTQATLFRDDAHQDLIIAFRGTSSVQDFVSDFNQTLVPFSGCENCTVCIWCVYICTCWFSVQVYKPCAQDTYYLWYRFMEVTFDNGTL